MYNGMYRGLDKDLYRRMDSDMPRKKQEKETHRIPINLDMSKPEHRAIWDYWQGLTTTGEAAEWARSALSDALPEAERVDYSALLRKNVKPPYVPQSQVVRSAMGLDNEPKSEVSKPEPVYEPDDEFAGMTPNQKIRARQDKAKAKFGK